MSKTTFTIEIPPGRDDGCLEVPFGIMHMVKTSAIKDNGLWIDVLHRCGTVWDTQNNPAYNVNFRRVNNETVVLYYIARSADFTPGLLITAEYLPPRNPHGTVTSE